jgi:carboxypeptidase PM20D1
MKFQGPGADMLKSIAPHASPVVKIFAANTWLFAPLLVKVTAKTPAGAAMLHTTIAPTMLKGSPKENVLPQDATAWINYRIAPRRQLGHGDGAGQGRGRQAAGRTLLDQDRRALADLLDQLGRLEDLGGPRRRREQSPGRAGPGHRRHRQPLPRCRGHDVYRFQPLVLKVDEISA